MIEQWADMIGSFHLRLIAAFFWLFLGAALMLPLERLATLRKQPVLREHWLQDLGYYFLGCLTPAFFMVLTTAMVVATGHVLLPPSWFALMRELPTPVRLAATLVIGEIAYYWAHRWSHHWPDLWRLHAIHHSPKQLDWLVNTRAHPLDLVFARTVSFTPLFFLGLVQLDTQQGVDMNLILFTGLNTLWAFFIHSNSKIRLGPLEQLITSPAFHHWHHANDDASVVNKNFAALFPWIDRLFGTHYLPKDAFPKTYGIEDVLPETLPAQLFHPFRPGKTSPAVRAVQE
ncbi:sterol desaturase/sphingolipid hydroxylase (fatty acid hydroxylase superfamily) [Paucibacter oligotrophus]|uniref:Sterol desaturase/sphingolipid hydroxylase (Fatty acid hydroxylase superfamily) n=1 Tax=Roseateles oligotrophus TaxID=1769250 RepID=A0A840LBC5_9BURK|nr:sterol desaturase family protein [Roseateles oligotrophus]MBB4845470.1 sterol desaturase/sphingolipid hydroxylase (fatty acid hydroxylase superfamily) [Roseateles oligotrophus]